MKYSSFFTSIAMLTFLASVHSIVFPGKHFTRNAHAASNYYYFFEAEKAHTALPMKINPDPSASGHKYVATPEGAGNDKGYLTRTFTVDVSGGYDVWGLVKGSNNDSNAFYVSIDNSVEKSWSFAPTNSWNWDVANPIAWNLPAGSHTLKIRTREDGTQLDKIIITNDSHYIPGFMHDSTLPKSEIGAAASNHDMRSFTFSQELNNPVIILGPSTSVDNAPGFCAITNVYSNLFEYKFNEWDYQNGHHGYETCSFLAVEAGHFLLPDNATELVADTIDIPGNYKQWTTVAFDNTFSSVPVVFASAQTHNDPQKFIVSIKDVTPMGFKISLMEQENYTDGHGIETIGYIAVTPSQASVLPYTTTSVPCTDKGCDALGRRLYISEEKSADSELWHTSETIQSMVLGGHLFAQAKTANGDNPYSLRKTDNRAMDWIRSNPMFISGLMVHVDESQASHASSYYDDFHATANHFVSGLPSWVMEWETLRGEDYRWVSWTQKDGDGWNGKFAGGLDANVRGRIGYQVGDEPSSFTDYLDHMEAIANLRAHDPGAMMIMDFSNLPADLPQQLNHFGRSENGDVFSCNRYDRDDDVYEKMEQIRTHGLAHGKPYWRYLNSFMFSQDPQFEHHESDLRWDAFAGLVYGFTGHTWFVYQNKSTHSLLPIFFKDTDTFDSPKTNEFWLAAQINQEMANLGRTITQLTSTDVRFIPYFIFEQPEDTKNWSPGAGDDPYITRIYTNDNFLEILVGFFQDINGELYFMVQNTRHKHDEFPMNRADPGTIHVEFDFSPAPPEFNYDALLTLNKETSKIDTLSLTNLGGATRRLSVTLKAGDPILLKYQNGVPFRLQVR